MMSKVLCQIFEINETSNHLPPYTSTSKTLSPKYLVCSTNFKLVSSLYRCGWRWFVSHIKV